MKLCMYIIKFNKTTREKTILNLFYVLFKKIFPAQIFIFHTNFRKINYQLLKILIGLLYSNLFCVIIYCSIFCLNDKLIVDQRLLSLRKWEDVNENRSNRPGFIFTLMSYNILSQDLLAQHPYLYNRHNNAFLQWSVRWNNLFNEITKFKPDVCTHLYYIFLINIIF